MWAGPPRPKGAWVPTSIISVLVFHLVCQSMLEWHVMGHLCTEMVSLGSFEHANVFRVPMPVLQLEVGMVICVPNDWK